MALTDKTKEVLPVSLASELAGQDLINEFDKLDEVAALGVIATSDSIDLATAIALANETKAKINEIITTLNAE